jgi:hypothetical protein
MAFFYLTISQYQLVLGIFCNTHGFINIRHSFRLNVSSALDSSAHYIILYIEKSSDSFVNQHLSKLLIPLKAFLH